MNERTIKQLISVLTVEQLENALQGTYDELVNFALTEPSDKQREAVIETARIVNLVKEEIAKRKI